VDERRPAAAGRDDAGRMMRGTLNLFQATMLRWRDTHPYMAVHAAPIDGRIDVARMEAAIGRELTHRGLANLTLDIASRRYDYAGGDVRVTLPVLDGGSEPYRVLTDEMERQLNRPFARAGRIDPFRFFAVAGGPSFHVALAYDHFIAGGDSVAQLMQGICDRYAGRADDARAVPALYPATYRHWLLRRPGGFLRSLPSMLRLALSGRHYHRPRYPHGPDPTNALTHFRLDADEFAQVMRVVRAWRVTLNDLVLAVTLLSLAPLTGKRRTARRRVGLAAASIVNIRRDLGVPSREVFGQFLSSFHVAHLVPDGVALPDLTRDIHAQTTRIKRLRLYLQTLSGMGYSGIVWPHLKPEQRQTFHEKNYPVWAGITMLNVDALWSDAGGPARAGYVRAVSTGPLTPMVVAPTTAGNALEVVITYRIAAFERATAEAVADRIREALRTLTA
jgi:hypothetical protein